MAEPAAPDQELIKACLDRLRADAAMQGLVGTAIYDRAPESRDGKPNNPEGDYVTVGPTTMTPDNASCIDASEIVFQLDAWSSGNGEAYGSARVRKIASAMRRSLDDAEIGLADNALVVIAWTLTQTMRDPDGVTNHAAVQFTAVIETP